MSFKLKKTFLILLLSLIILITPGTETSADNKNVIKTQVSHEEDLFKRKTINDGDLLTVQDCVSVAFYNSPVIKKYKYNLDIAKSNVGIAKSEYFPVIGAGISFYHENNSNVHYFHSHYEEIPAVALTINKLVWNFGKTTAYIKMEEFYKIGAEYEFIDSLCKTLFEIKEKYYNLLLAQTKLKFEEHNIELNEECIKEAERLAKTGKDRKADISNAKMNLSKAKIEYIHAENQYKNAKIDLNNAMYLDSQPDYTISETSTYTYKNEYTSDKKVPDFKIQKLPFELDQAVEIAYKNSPDLKVLLSTKKAMEQSLVYIKRMYLPDLNINAGYGYNNTNVTNSDNSFKIGASLNSTINIMNLKHSIQGASAQLNIADNEINLFKKNLYFKVKTALNNLEKAEREIPAAQMEAEQAYTNFQIVLEDYKNEKTNYVALQNARTDYHTALNEYANALYEYNIALIEVEMSMHCHIIDIHHKSEHAVHYHKDELIEHISKWMNCDEKEIKRSKKQLGL